MDSGEFREALINVMERKQHWAWPGFTSGLVPQALLHVHLEQEYATYVRDFPVLVGRAYVDCPVAAARRELIANVYEEETGGLIAGRPHPELFLEYPRGLGMDLERFHAVELLPAARRYRAFLDEATLQRGWSVAAAVTTLFVEGTPNERRELDPRHGDNAQHSPLEEHPLVKHYGLPLERLALTKAHRAVEHEHRRSAWQVVIEHVAVGERPAVVLAMSEALERWQAYRDDVAGACALEKAPDGTPRLASLTRPGPC